MSEHLLTMHTTDERDRLWISCSCGFETEPVEIDAAEQWKPIQAELATLGLAHIAAAKGGAP